MLVTRDDRGFNISVTIQHMAEHILQARQRSLPGNVVIAANFFLGDQTKRPAHGFWRVMESRLQGDFRIVQSVGIELDLGSGSASAKEIHRTTFANHLDGPLPSLGTADGLNGYVGAATLWT